MTGTVIVLLVAYYAGILQVFQTSRCYFRIILHREQENGRAIFQQFSENQGVWRSEVVFDLRDPVRVDDAKFRLYKLIN